MSLAPPHTGEIVFSATLELGGKTATGIEVPEHVVEQLGAGKRPPVRVMLNGHAYRSTIARMRGRYMLPVSTVMRERAHVDAGDDVEVRLTHDTEPRTVTLPPDFADALREDRAAQDFFNTLSYSNRRRFVLSVEGAKTHETRQRRIARAVAALREERT